MVVKIYVSGISGNKEVKKKQQRVQMILDSKSIVYEAIDITEPGREKDKEKMQSKAKVREVLGKHPLPPQLFNEEEYCGDYEDFDLANEVDELEAFLHLPIPSKLISCDNETLTAKVNGSRENIDGNVRNGEAEDKVNGDVELTSVNCEGDVSAPATDAVSSALPEDEEVADNDATPEENIVNSTPTETQENPQTFKNELEEGDKENEVDSIITGEKTEDDRLDEEEKVEDENNDDELITQQENDVPDAEINIEGVVSENKKVDEAEEIGVDKKGSMPVSLDKLLSESPEYDNNLITASSINNFDFSTITRSHATAEKHLNNKATLEEVNNNLTPALEVNLRKISEVSIPEAHSQTLLKPKETPLNVLIPTLNIPLPSELEQRKMYELEKTVPLEWKENVHENVLTSNLPLFSSLKPNLENLPLNANLLQSDPCLEESIKKEIVPTKCIPNEKLVSLSDLDTIDLKIEPEISISKGEEIESIKLRETGSPVEGIHQDTTNNELKLKKGETLPLESNNASEVSSSRKNSIESKKLKDTDSHVESIKHVTINNELKIKEDETLSLEANYAGDVATSVKNSKEIIDNLKNEMIPVPDLNQFEKLTSSPTIIPSNKPNDSMPNIINETRSKESVEDQNKIKVADTLMKDSMEQSVEIKGKLEFASDSGISDHSADEKALLSYEEKKINPSEIKNEKIDINIENVTKKSITSEDDWGQGKPLCRRDTLKNIKRPSITLLRPSSIKEEKEKELISTAFKDDRNEVDPKFTTDSNCFPNNPKIELNKSVLDNKKYMRIDPIISCSSNDEPLSNVSNQGIRQKTLQSSPNQTGIEGYPTGVTQNISSDNQNNNLTLFPLLAQDALSINSALIENSVDSINSSLTDAGNANTYQLQNLEADAASTNRSSQSSSNDNQNRNLTLLPGAARDAVNSNSNASQKPETDVASTNRNTQSSSDHSQNKNLTISSSGGASNVDSGAIGPSIGQNTSSGESLNTQLKGASGQSQLTDNNGATLPNTDSEHHPEGVPMKDLLKETYITPFSVDKIAYSPQLVSKIKSDSLARNDEKGVVLPNWDRRPSEVDLVRQVRHLLDERDTEVAISRARMRAGRSPLPDPQRHFLAEMRRMINKYKADEEEVSWPVVPPPREPTPPPPPPPVNEFLQEVLKALNAPYIPKPKPPNEEPQENIFLNQVQVLLDSEQMTGDSQATFFQKERGAIEDTEFVHKVRIILDERESTLGLKPIEHPEKRDHTEFLSEVLVLLEEPSKEEIQKPIETIDIRDEPNVVNVEQIPVVEEVKLASPPSPQPVEQTANTSVKPIKENPVKTPEEPKKKEIEIAQIFIRDNIFPVKAQVSSDNFRIFVSALGSKRVELQKEDLDALTITVVEDNGYKSDVAKIVEIQDVFEKFSDKPSPLQDTVQAEEQEVSSGEADDGDAE